MVDSFRFAGEPIDPWSALGDFLLGLTFESSDAVGTDPSLERRGLFWARRIAHDAAGNVFAARVTPGVALQDSPVVEIGEDSAEAHTVASSLRVFLPTYAAHRLVKRARQRRPHGLSDADWDRLVALEELLGGRGLMAKVRDVASDEVVREAIAVEATRAAAVAGLLRMFDPAPSATAFAAALSSPGTPLDAWLGDFGPWTAAARVIALRAAVERADLRAEAGWQLFANHLFALDTSRGHDRPWEPDAELANEVLWDASAAVVATDNAAWKADPAWKVADAVVMGFDRAQSAFDAALALSDWDPERGYTMYANAAFLGVAESGQADPMATEGALALAREHRWENVVAALEQVVARRTPVVPVAPEPAATYPGPEQEPTPAPAPPPPSVPEPKPEPEPTPEPLPEPEPEPAPEPPPEPKPIPVPEPEQPPERAEAEPVVVVRRAPAVAPPPVAEAPPPAPVHEEVPTLVSAPPAAGKRAPVRKTVARKTASAPEPAAEPVAAPPPEPKKAPARKKADTAKAESTAKPTKAAKASKAKARGDADTAKPETTKSGRAKKKADA